MQLHDPQVVAAFVTAVGTILAAMIGGASVLLIAWHRRNVIELARSVEAYYCLETQWVRQLLASEGVTQPNDGQITQRRGRLRKDVMGDGHPGRLLTGKQAKSLRMRYFSYE